MPKVVAGYKEAARSKIVEAGSRIFSSRGYGGSTMDEVAKELGVSKGALYLYFRSKDDLLAAVYRCGQESLRETLHAAFRNKTVSEGLEEAYRQLFENKQENIRIMYEMTGLAINDERVRESLKEAQEGYLGIVYELLRDQVKKGALKNTPDLRLKAELLTVLYAGLARMSILGFAGSTIHRLWTESSLMILGLNPKTTGASREPKQPSLVSN